MGDAEGGADGDYGGCGVGIEGEAFDGEVEGGAEVLVRPAGGGGGGSGRAPAFAQAAGGGGLRVVGDVADPYVGRAFPGGGSTAGDVEVALVPDTQLDGAVVDDGGGGMGPGLPAGPARGEDSDGHQRQEAQEAHEGQGLEERSPVLLFAADAAPPHNAVTEPI